MKESQKNISEDFDEFWMDYVDGYLKVCREYNLTSLIGPSFYIIYLE